MDVVFKMLRPTDARLVLGSELDAEQRFEVSIGRSQALPAPSQRDWFIVWTHTDHERITGPQLLPALREYLRLNGADPQDVLAFVRKWGVFNENGVLHVSRLWAHAAVVQSVLAVLIASGEGSDPEFDEGADAAREDLVAIWPTAQEVVHGIDSSLREANAAAWVERHFELPFSERLRQQRLLLAHAIQAMAQSLHVTVSWEDRRRVVVVAPGVRGLIGAIIRQVFESHSAAFYCSNCKRPSVEDPAVHTRRPRADRGRFCGPECRDAATLARKRLYWRTNKDRLRPAKGRAKSGEQKGESR